MGPEQSSQSHSPAWPDAPQRDRPRHGVPPLPADDRYGHRDPHDPYGTPSAPASGPRPGRPADSEAAGSWPGVPQTSSAWADDPLGVRPSPATHPVADAERTVTLHDRADSGPQRQAAHSAPVADPYLGPLGPRDRREAGHYDNGHHGNGRIDDGRRGSEHHGTGPSDTGRPSNGHFENRQANGQAGGQSRGMPAQATTAPQAVRPSAAPAGPGEVPGGALGRDPADPNRPFVTAGQISGPKTPPPQRQQELWNTVFGENYQAIGEEEELDDPPGRPVWIFALVGSVVAALIAVALWAFLAGPLAADDGGRSGSNATSASAESPASGARPQTARRLPKYSGQASPVEGVLTDEAAAVGIPRLGAPWRLDERPTVRRAYGFTTRQYVPAGRDAAGKAQYAQLMTGALSPRLAEKYTSPENLTPVISTVAWHARNKFFPEGNTIAKVAQQALTVDGLPGQLIAYEVTAGKAKTTMVVAAVTTGRDLPAIVYMSVPASKKELLPDVNQVFRRIRLANS